MLEVRNQGTHDIITHQMCNNRYKNNGKKEKLINERDIKCKSLNL